MGVYDLLRFHLFTIGFCWITEYGDPDSKDDFPRLLRLSPYHRLLRIVKNSNRNKKLDEKEERVGEMKGNVKTGSKEEKETDDRHGSFNNATPSVTQVEESPRNANIGTSFHSASSTSDFLTPNHAHQSDLDLSALLDSVSSPGLMSGVGGPGGFLSPTDDHVDFFSLHLICNSESPVMSPANAMLSPALLSSFSALSASSPLSCRVRRFAEGRSNTVSSPMPFSSYAFDSPSTPSRSQPLKLTLPFLDETPEVGDYFAAEEETSAMRGFLADAEVANKEIHSTETFENLVAPQHTENADFATVDHQTGEATPPSLDFTVDEVRRSGFPSVICLTSSTDDRVVPMHSFKFVAALQALINGMREAETDVQGGTTASVELARNKNLRDSATEVGETGLQNSSRFPASTEARFPVALLRVEESVGHGYGKGTGKAINELVDIFSFIGRTVDLKWKDECCKG